MKNKGLFLIAGIILIALKSTKIIFIENIWIIACILIWFIMHYLYIKKKNKEARNPKPVYITN